MPFYLSTLKRKALGFGYKVEYEIYALNRIVVFIIEQ